MSARMYHLMYVPVSGDQFRRLVHQETVRLSKDAVASIGDSDNGLPILLTNTQIKKLSKAKESGKGSSLKLSHAQIRASANHTEGGSIFSDALKKVGAFFKDKVLPVAKKGVANLLEDHGENAINTVADALEGVVPSALKPFFDIGRELGTKHAKEQLQAIIEGMRSGSGLRLSGARNGSGILSDLLF